MRSAENPYIFIASAVTFCCRAHTLVHVRVSLGSGGTLIRGCHQRVRVRVGVRMLIWDNKQMAFHENAQGAPIS